MELSFALSLVVLLGGQWFYLLGSIRTLTAESPSATPLYFYGEAHWVVTVYFTMSLIVLYQLGIGESTYKSGSAWAVLALTRTWPAGALVALIPAATANVLPSNSKAFDWARWVSVAVIVVSAIWIAVRQQTSMGLSPISLVLLVTFLASLGSLLYIIVMSEIFADVTIQTDKELYKADEDVLVSIRTTGYLVRPRITELALGSFRRTSAFDQTYLIKSSERGGDWLIKVTYETEAGSIARERFHELHVVRNE